MAGLKTWMVQIRANFLVLSVFLVLLGAALSVKYPGQRVNMSLFQVLLIMAGVISAHISVNLFNEYSDYHTKIDFKTRRTAFSGGSGMMVAGKNSPGAVLRVAIITLILSLSVGIYFSLVSHWIILVFALLGSFSILFYTDFLSKYMLGELFAGLTLGTLVVLGTYISLRAEPGQSLAHILPVEAIWLSIPPGILTALLLLINQFPDVEADAAGGRRHLVIGLGIRKAGWIYAGGMVAVFAIIILVPIAGIGSYWLYLGLMPLPLAVKASITAIRFEKDQSRIVAALANNVMTVLGVDLLLAVGVFVDVL
ncbi:MAG TPA: prenyltransferase [Bacteroidales bacterium]|nr:prenyltransferase [Bacteroidales bacterium]